MHPDLVYISNVWQADVRIDTLRTEHETLSAAIVRATKQRDAAEQAAAAAKETLDAVVKAERANARELDTYVKKRDESRRMINEGTSPDYAATERQLAQCIQLVDDYET